MYKILEMEMLEMGRESEANPENRQLQDAIRVKRVQSFEVFA